MPNRWTNGDRERAITLTLIGGERHEIMKYSYLFLVLLTCTVVWPPELPGQQHRRGAGTGRAVAGRPARCGIVRLRPVMITVGATVLGLVPLAMHGGPLWEPLCYAQIGGLSLATFITLLLVPVFYSIAALDLKIVK